LIIGLPLGSLLLSPTVHCACRRACTGVPGNRARCVLGLLRSHRSRIDTRLLFRHAVALVLVFGLLASILLV
jgi:hypothetical protein